MSDIERGDIPNRRWIAGKLRACRMVNWDRFTISDWGDVTAISVYGWIGREDSHEDFVLVVFWPEEEDLANWTSSAKYSEEITEILHGDADDHSPCHRVEDAFNVSNQVTLTEVSD